MLAKEHADIADIMKLRNSSHEMSGSNYDNVYKHTVESLISTSAYLETLLTLRSTRVSKNVACSYTEHSSEDNQSEHDTSKSRCRRRVIIGDILDSAKVAKGLAKTPEVLPCLPLASLIDREIWPLRAFFTLFLR